ncbi:helix-turn-helix domain-containing protein [Nocardiopsis sp. N85]|uniref:helix-turn-helix domain-containing protein n=1 Tax=Nocardiopsis sp. N85 TaxID=3029400 RepID=UPI00406D1FA0
MTPGAGCDRDTRFPKGLSQAALAARAGVVRSWPTRVEAGRRGAGSKPLLRLPAALDLTPTLRSNADADAAEPRPISCRTATRWPRDFPPDDRARVPGGHAGSTAAGGC